MLCLCFYSSSSVRATPTVAARTFRCCFFFIVILGFRPGLPPLHVVVLGTDHESTEKVRIDGKIVQTINRRTSSSSSQAKSRFSRQKRCEAQRERGRARERDTVIYMCIPYSHYYISLDSNYCYRLIAPVAILRNDVDDFSHAFDSSLGSLSCCSSPGSAWVIPL